MRNLVWQVHLRLAHKCYFCIQLLYNLSLLFWDMIAQIEVATTVWMFGLVYLALFNPPTPKYYASPDCTPVTSPRVHISDGRYFSSKEGGVSKEKAKNIIIIFHCFNSSKDLIYQYLKYENNYNSIHSIMTRFTYTCNAFETQKTFLSPIYNVGLNKTFLIFNHIAGTREVGDNTYT